MEKQILSAAAGKTTADLAVINGKIVNVYSGEIYDGGVAVSGDTIIAVGQVQDYIGTSTKVLDAEGQLPGKKGNPFRDIWQGYPAKT